VYSSGEMNPRSTKFPIIISPNEKPDRLIWERKKKSGTSEPDTNAEPNLKVK